MRLRFLAAAMLFAAFATRFARADEFMIFTFNTTVTSNIDGTLDGAGLFGPVGANLVGDAATIVYTVDLNLGVPDLGQPFQTGLFTPPTLDLSTLNVAASITINGRTFTSTPPQTNVGETIFLENSANGIPTQLELSVLTGTTTCTNLYNNGCLPVYGQDEEVTFQDYFNVPNYGADFEYEQPSANSLPITTIVSVANVAPVVTVSVTPEPEPFFLLGTGALAIVGTQHRRWRRVRS